MVGRMLQCMSVLASVGHVPGTGPAATVAGVANSRPAGMGPGAAPNSAVDTGDDGNRMIEELNKLLKLNWLGRGRTGRNRRGIVGGRVRRAGLGVAMVPAESVREGIAEAA